VTESYPSAHFDGGNTGYVPDPAGGQRTFETFDTIWSFETDGELRASPVVSDEVVVVGDMNGVVYGLNAINGREHWRTSLDAPSVFASAAVIDGTVFVSGYDDLNRAEATVFALDLATGEVQWARDFDQGGRTGVKTDGERVYIQTDDGACYALDSGTGETIWRIDGERHNKLPALDAGLVIRKDGEALVALDAKHGTERWRTDVDGRVLTPPVVDDGRVYVVTGSSELWCLDSATGKVVWHINIDTAIREHPATSDPLLPVVGGVLDSKPVTDGESIFIGIYKGLVEIDAIDGRLLSYDLLDQRLYDPLLVGTDDERCLYGSVDTDGVTQFQLTPNGASWCRSSVPDALNTAPAYATGVLYISTELDGVFAIS